MSLKEIRDSIRYVGHYCYLGMPILVGENAILYGSLYRENGFYLASGAVAFVLGGIDVLRTLLKGPLDKTIFKIDMFEYSPLPTVAIAATLVSSLAPLEFIVDQIK